MTDLATVDASPTGASQTTGSDAADKPPVDPAVTAFINSWVERIKAAKKTKKTEAAFKRMDECMQLAKDGANKEWIEDGKKYVVPVLNRLTNQSVAQLYAKNPKAYAKRKPRRMFTVWDGTLASLNEAKQMLQMSAAMPPQVDPMGQPMPPQIDPHVMAVIADAEKVKQYDTLMDGVADTLTILHNHFLQDPAAQYKQQFKSLVRRAKVCGVGYVKLSFQRILEPNPDAAAQLSDATEKLAVTKRLIAEAARDALPEESAEMEQLRTLIENLGEQTELLVQEGPVFSFPRSKKIIIDPACHQLKTLAGAGWIAEEYDDKTPADIEESWGVDVGGQYTEYKPDNNQPDSWQRWSEKQGELKKTSAALVWRVMNKKTGQEFVICEGYKDYIKPPAPPAVKLSRFWDIFPLVFNEIESEDDLYPPSDVWNARHLQNEYNRSRQGLREHRLANRPAYVSGHGTFEEKDLDKFESHASGAIIATTRQLNKDEKIADLLQAKPVMQIDPKQYEVDGIWQDILRTTGQQQANVGPTAGATATESSIAEHSNQAGISDSTDDIDELLSAVVQAAGQVMLTEMSKETVMSIVGPGAIWPEQVETREEIAESISLDVKAGSSGRPNAAEDLRKMQMAMPIIVQIPGMPIKELGEKYLDLLEIDVVGAVLEGAPSIAAINAMMSKPPAPAGGESDPNAQGGEGADNDKKQPEAAPAPGPTETNYDHQGNPIR